MCLVSLSLIASSFGDNKVQVGFYAESLCPDCIALSTKYMNKAVEEVGKIFDLLYVPWGNARLLSDGTFLCQHGKMECIINTVDACVLHYYPQREQFWPFIYCMDEAKEDQDMSVAQRCAEKSNLNWDNIDTCSSGSMGHDLELMYYNMTASLQPPHKYTPWITINGKHNTEAEGSGLIKAICEAYIGSDKPVACK